MKFINQFLKKKISHWFLRIWSETALIEATRRLQCTASQPENTELESMSSRTPFRCSPSILNPRRSTAYIPRSSSFSFDFHNLDLIISVNVPGSLECRACWNPTDPDKYGTGVWGTKIFKTFGTQLQTANKLELCKFGFSQHHDDIQGTLLLMGQVQLQAQGFIMIFRSNNKENSLKVHRQYFGLILNFLPKK